MNWLKSIIDAINLLMQEGAALSILLGLFIAIAGTQFVKKLEAFPSNKWWIRALALPLGFFPTFFTWPVHEITAIRIFVAFAVGFGAPIVYQIVTQALYWKWPHLEPKLSACPAHPSKPDPGK